MNDWVEVENNDLKPITYLIRKFDNNSISNIEFVFCELNPFVVNKS